MKYQPLTSRDKREAFFDLLVLPVLLIYGGYRTYVFFRKKP